MQSLCGTEECDNCRSGFSKHGFSFYKFCLCLCWNRVFVYWLKAKLSMHTYTQVQMWAAGPRSTQLFHCMLRLICLQRVQLREMRCGGESLCGPRGLYETSLCILRCPKMLFLTHELVCVGCFFFLPTCYYISGFFLRVFRFLSKVMLWCCREYSVLSSAAVFWSVFFLAAFLYLFPSCTAHGKGSQHLSGLSGALLEHKEPYHSTDTELMMHR